MRVTPQRLPEVHLIEPDVHADSRGFLFEAYNQARYQQAGIDASFVQDNVSHSCRGTLRGLHLQHPQGQGKLVTVLQGEVFDVSVDVRVGSPRFGQWCGRVLSDQSHAQLYIPPGFAHGFQALSEHATFTYKCTTYYAPAHELSIAWNDPDLGVDWPLSEPALSGRDRQAPRLAEVPHQRLPSYTPTPA